MPFERPDLLSATHPSDHNAVRFMAQTAHAHSLMTTKYENLAKKKARKKEKAAKKAAASMEAKARGSTIRSNGGGHQLAYYEDGVYDPNYTQAVGPDGKRSRSSYAHSAAFLLPVPLFFGVGLYAYGGCVSAGGLMVDSRGGCGGVRYFLLFSLSFIASLTSVSSFSVLQAVAAQEAVAVLVVRVAAVTRGAVSSFK